ncbi:MAG: ATP-binding protein [Sphaerochaetaceae bacterium]|nr:ATP-binding protein [Sphaerochaetaceae bacterium]
MENREIKREFYLSKLIEKKGNGFIKVITGIRRCGKSYLVFKQFKNHLLLNGVDKEHIFEMVFDDRRNAKYRNPDVFDELVDSQIGDGGIYYILLDEVQMLDDFEGVLNGLLRRHEVDIYVTGSNAKFLSRDVITEFRGRGDEVHLNPLSFSEFMSAYDGNKYDGWNEYVQFGGLPPVVLQQNTESKIKTLNDLNKETYIRDITSRHNIRNKAEFEELLNVLASGIGALANPTKLADTFKTKKKIKISKNTIDSYIDYLIDAFLVEKAQRYDIKGKKYIDTPFKYYFSDIGLRNAQIGFRQIEETHIMENVIYNELRIRGYNVDIGVVNTAELKSDGKKQKKQLEIDFVCNKASKRYYIQSAFALPDSKNTEQEQKSFLKINDSFKKVIITKDVPGPWYTEEGVLITGLFDFLLDKESLEKI